MLIYYYLDHISKKKYSSANHQYALINEISSRYGIKEKTLDEGVNKNELFKVFLYTLKIPQKNLISEFNSEMINIQKNKYPLFIRNFLFKNLRIPLHINATSKSIVQYNEIPVLKPKKDFISILNLSSYTNLFIPDFFDTNLGVYNLMKELSIPDVIVVPTQHIKDELIEKLFIKESKISILPSGLSECFFVNPTEPKMKLPEKYILFTGKISMYKNLERLINIFDKINKKDYSLVIAGDIDTRYETFQHALTYKKELMNIAATMEENRIIFTGHLDKFEIASILKKSSGLIDPSYHNSFPDSILEAQAMGIPVIASDIPQHRAFLKDTVNYFTPNSDVSFAEAMEDLISGEKDKTELDKAKNFAKQYAWSKVVDLYADFYKSLV